MNITPRLRRSLTAGVIGLASVAGLAGAASASPASDARASHRDMGQVFAQLSDDQRQCLTDAGVTRPAGRPTVEQRKALRAAAEDCGISAPGRGAGSGTHPTMGSAFANLSDEQRQCLTDAGVSRPTGRPTVEQRTALRTAAEDCGIQLPVMTGRG